MSTFAEIFGPQGFDCNSVDPTDDFLKPGDYTVQIMESSIAPNKAQTGHYLKLVMQVVQEGENKGRKIYDYINIQNPNSTTEKMAARSLSALGRATNIREIKLPEQLLNQIVIAVVTKNDSGNNVRTYKPVSETQSAPTGQTPASAGAIVDPPAAPPAPGMPSPSFAVPQTVGPPALAAPVYHPVSQSTASMVNQVAPPAPAVPAAIVVAGATPAPVYAVPQTVAPPSPAVPPVAAVTTPPAVTGVPVWHQPPQ